MADPSRSEQTDNAEETDVHVDFLRPLVDGPGPWASVYTPAPPTDESGAKERELAVRDMCRTLAEQGADPVTIEAVRTTLSGLAPSDAPHGAAVFGAGGRVALWHALPRPVTAPGTHWAALPHLVPLVEACDPDARCLVARIDRTGADFDLHSGGTERPAGEVRAARYPVHRTASGDWSERNFQLKVENTWERNAGEIARVLAQAAGECGADTVVLAGDPRERQEVFDRLPSDLQDRTTLSDHGGRAVGASSELLDRDVEEARHELVRSRDRDLLDRFQAAGGSQAVAGVPALVEAAREHRLDTLLLHPDGADLNREVWVGPDADQLSVRRTQDEPVSAQAGDALLRAAVATGAAVAVVGADRAEAGPRDLRRTNDESADGSEAAGTGSDGGTPARDVQHVEHVLAGGLGAIPRWTHEGGADTVPA